MRKLFFVFTCCTILITACNTGTNTETTTSDNSSSIDSQESKEERNKQIALESMRALINNNPDEALKNAAPDAIDYYDGSGPATKGLDSIKAGMKMWLNNLEGYKGENLEAVADGNKVFVYGDWTGTFKNDFMGMKVGGKSFKLKDVDIFTFNDAGKITEHRSVQSMDALVASTKQGAQQ